MSPYSRARNLSGRIARALIKAKYYNQSSRADALASRLHRVYQWMVEHPHHGFLLA